MSKVLIFSLIALLYSCKPSSDNKSISKIDRDTLNFKYIRQSKNLKEILYYKNNKPYRSFCINGNSDTIKTPTAIFNDKKDSIFAFFPLQVQNIDNRILFDVDSGKIAAGIPADFSIYNVRKSGFYKIHPKMINIKNEIRGCLVAKEDSELTKFYPFLLKP